MLIQLLDQEAGQLLHDLEARRLIRVLEENSVPVKPKLSDKYRGVITSQEGQQLNEHLRQMRSEWSDS